MKRQLHSELFSSESVVALEPKGASGLCDVAAGGDAEGGDCRLAVIDKLGIGLVKEVVHAEGERQVLVGTVGEAKREDASRPSGRSPCP